MTIKMAHPLGQDASCQLMSYVDAHGEAIVIRGKEYRFENIRVENGLSGFADAFTTRAKYPAMRVRGSVIGRPGAEPWVIMRTSGGGACLAKFAIHNGKLLELT
jgi:hypothetical protein